VGRWIERRSRVVVLLAMAVAVLAAGAVAVVVDEGDRVRSGVLTSPFEAEEVAEPEPAALPSTTPTTSSRPVPTTAPPTTVPPPPPAPGPVAAATAGGRFTLDPYLGLGAWIDVFDWSWTFTSGQPHVGPADVDRMASLGVRTLYVQVSRYDHPADVVDADLLVPILDRARALGMRVVGWYLPTLTDPAADLRRTMAMAALPLDGIGIDIESRDVADVHERNARLVAYSAELRRLLPGEVIAGIVLPPVVMEDVNPNYWPGFPWRELAPYYDVWQPMAYWSNRRFDSGWRDGYAYTASNIDRIRERLGWLDAPVHPIGGIGDAVTAEQVAGMVQAARERGSLGGSLYDYRTTHDALWAELQPFNG
jgi:hypothetical protein